MLHDHVTKEMENGKKNCRMAIGGVKENLCVYIVLFQSFVLGGSNCNATQWRRPLLNRRSRLYVIRATRRQSGVGASNAEPGLKIDSDVTQPSPMYAGCSLL